MNGLRLLQLCSGFERIREDSLESYLVIFDLDGTLVHSKIDFDKMKMRMRGHLSSIGLDVSPLSQDASTQQITEHALSYLGDLEDSRRVAVVGRLREIMNSIELENVEKTTPIPGAEDALRKLSESGIHRVVVTRGCREYAAVALEVAHLSELVSLVLGRDDVEHPKPDPESINIAMSALGVAAADCVMVGDALSDALCAERAGVDFIPVLTGIGRREEFAGRGYRPIGSVAELLTSPCV